MQKNRKKTKNKGGRPSTAVKPSRSEFEIKEDVMMLAAAQWPEDDIALVLGITHKELKTKYQDELTFGPAREKAMLIKALRRKARTGDVPACRLLISLGDESSFLRKRVAARPMAQVKPEKEIKKKIKAEPKLGKKVQEVIAAKKSHKGTTWEDHLTKQ